MSTEMVVNVSPRETRAALLENGVLQELFIERASRRGLAGNLYKGRVSRVLPGMQAAFIDIGLERTAFLHVSDIVQPADAEGAVDAPRTDSIRELVGEGADILVQVLKDPLGTKGARLTTFITIPSRYLVYMPFGRGVGVSARIETEAERQRLREAMQAYALPGGTGGYIVRTAAEGATGEALRADMMFLRKLWDVLTERARGATQGTLVHEDLPLPLRLMRDLVGEGLDRVLVDNERTCEQMREFALTFMPGLEARVERYSSSRPLFDLHGVEEEIQRSLERKVALKSGGYLIIDQTEALTTIDVNTGAYVGHRNLEETIYRTNLEAAVAIARQLRLRNLGGIIIIDFIDMERKADREAVLNALQEALKKDRAKTNVANISELGLVQ
ncbi:MAG: ribonuclease, partial [Pseudomonadota bacterium]|nr:ribonuclease [Pseudomonadota bacterium]